MSFENYAQIATDIEVRGETCYPRLSFFSIVLALSVSFVFYPFLIVSFFISSFVSSHFVLFYFFLFLLLFDSSLHLASFLLTHRWNVEGTSSAPHIKSLTICKCFFSVSVSCIDFYYRGVLAII